MSTDKSEEKNPCDVKVYDDVVISVQRIAKVVGIRLQSDDSPRARFLWKAFYWFGMCNMLLGGGLEVGKILQTLRGGKFQVEIFLMVPVLGYTLLSISKSWSVISQGETYDRILRTFHDLWPRGSLTADERRVVTHSLTELSIFIKGYQMSNMTTFTIYYLKPWIDLTRSWRGAQVTFVLPFFYWLPYDFQNYYLPTLILQMWHGMLITVFVVVGDLLYSLMLNQISMQLDLLAVQLENIVQVHCDQQLKEEFPLGLHQGEANEVSGTPAEIATDRDETEAKLISIIKRHVVLIKLGEDVEGILSISLLINFVNSSMILCFCGYCCVLVEKWNELAYKSFLVTAMCQTFLLCWYGQKLLDASVRVSCAAYNCGWYVMSAKIRKYLLYIMMRAQKPVSVTAYGYCVIGFKCYTTIVKTAWSYFTLLLNVLK